jgi:hypothetical protein
VLGDSDGATLTAPLTEIALALAEATDAAAADVAVLLDTTAEGDVSVVVELDVEDESVVDEAVDVESVVLDEMLPLEDEVVALPEVVVPVESVVVLFESTETVQLCTSWTAGLPLESVIGVKVITQVCVRGPDGVMELVTVIRVVGEERLAVEAVVACRLRRGNASETFKNRRASKKRATNKNENMADS